jgi:predicted transposase/invertase (TIGR01784 family)
MKKRLKKSKEKIVVYPTNDWIFKRIYGRKGSEQITEKFIKAFLGLDVKIIDLHEQKTLETDILSEKAGVLDILAETENGMQIDLEMQAGNYKFAEIRLTKYGCQLFANGIKKGEYYDKMRKTIAVMFVKDDLPILKPYPEYTFKWQFREEKYHDLILTDNLEIVIISLEKIKKEIEKGAINDKEKIALWTKFLLNPSTLKGEEMEENKEIKEANEIYENVTSDIGEINAAIRREQYYNDIASVRHEGYEEGLEKGSQNAIIKMAKKMLKTNIPIETIEKITGLTKEEIKKLK